MERVKVPSSSSKSESSSSLGCAVGWFCGVSMGGAAVVAGAESLSPGPEGVAMMNMRGKGKGGKGKSVRDEDPEACLRPCRSWQRSAVQVKFRSVQVGSRGHVTRRIWRGTDADRRGAQHTHTVGMDVGIAIGIDMGIDIGTNYRYEIGNVGLFVC